MKTGIGPLRMKLAGLAAACFIMACTGEQDGRAAPGDSTAVPQPADSGGRTAVDSVEPPALNDSTDPRWTIGTTNVALEPPAVAVLRDVRTARHDGFDRIVLDFGQDSLPSYSVEYVDRPVRQCGSGEPVPLAGDAWLQIRLEPAYAHTEAGAPTITDRARRPAYDNLLELKLICDFEAHVEWVAAVASPTRYRVLPLRAPSRLVIDIQHPRR